MHRITRISISLAAVAAALGLAVVAGAGGALSAPNTTARAAATAASSAATTQTRSVSCNAYQFVPVDTNTGSDYITTLRIRTGEVGSGFFICNPTLPTRAVVQKVQFSVLDKVAGSQVSLCGMYRAGLSTAKAAQSYQELASFPSTGEAQTPGFLRLTDTTIQNATIDNSNFSYWLQCNLDPDGAKGSTGIYGADVIYTISNING
jgi:hypothetical protein